MKETSSKVDDYLATLPDWQKAHLTLFRRLIHESSPAIVEDFKWNVPVFVLGGKVIFAMSGFKAHTKYNFMLNGALLDDKDKLFNNGLESKKSRGIDLRETEKIDENKLRNLITESLKSAAITS